MTVSTVDNVSGYTRQDCWWCLRLSPSVLLWMGSPVNQGCSDQSSVPQYFDVRIPDIIYIYIYIYILQANLFRTSILGMKRAGSGGCFPLHYDNPGPPNKRALTCLLYLNPNWEDGDGGEVCLTPFLLKEKAIAPVLDRLVGA